MHPDNSTIRNAASIKSKIDELRLLRQYQEQELRADFRTLKELLKPSSLIRNAVNDLKQDQEFKGNAMENAVNAGAGFLLDKLILRKGFGLKSYLINMGLKKALSFFVSKRKDTRFAAN